MQAVLPRNPTCVSHLEGDAGCSSCLQCRHILGWILQHKTQVAARVKGKGPFLTAHLTYTVFTLLESTFVELVPTYRQTKCKRLGAFKQWPRSPLGHNKQAHTCMLLILSI